MDHNLPIPSTAASLRPPAVPKKRKKQKTLLPACEDKRITFLSSKGDGFSHPLKWMKTESAWFIFLDATTIKSTARIGPNTFIIKVYQSCIHLQMVSPLSSSPCFGPDEAQNHSTTHFAKRPKLQKSNAKLTTNARAGQFALLAKGPLH